MDVKEYTARKLGEQLVAAEIHLTDYLSEQSNKSDKNDFCVECLAKHSLAITQFSQEGTQFFDCDPYFGRVYKEGCALYNDLPKFDKSKAEQHFETLRELRKEMVAKHLIMGPPSVNNSAHFGGHVKGDK